MGGGGRLSPLWVSRVLQWQASGAGRGGGKPLLRSLCLQTSIEEMIASTAYLDLFLRSISETALLKTFLRFLLLHHHDNSTILDTLVARIASNSRVRRPAWHGHRGVWWGSTRLGGSHSAPPNQSPEERPPSAPPPSKEQQLALAGRLRSSGLQEGPPRREGGAQRLCLVQGGLGGGLLSLILPFSLFPQLCMVSLSLFRTLISLHCEDVLLQLVLRYWGILAGVALPKAGGGREAFFVGKGKRMSPQQC